MYSKKTSSNEYHFLNIINGVRLFNSSTWKKNIKRGLLCPWSRLPKCVIRDLWVRGLNPRVGPTWSHNEHVLDFRWIFYLFPQNVSESYFREIIWVSLIKMELDVTKSLKKQPLSLNFTQVFCCKFGNCNTEIDIW